mmetsp:Transcript_6125/g.789  ORF Transcript_6125/g.789 Transcript_6125/m.789 type:complete len:123 (+) Transcript_6125:609-977(+)
MLTSSINFDLQSIIQEIASLLDDSKSKIRHVATEALATAVKIYGFTSIMEFLMPIVDDLALKILEERFKSSAIPILRQDGLIEFPKSVPSTAPVISSPYITTSSFGASSYSAYTEFSPQKPI